MDDKPLRVVVVGRESGWPKDPQLQQLARRVPLDARYRQIHDETGLRCRFYVATGHQGRNLRMRGTTQALRLITRKGPGADYPGEFIRPANGRPFHIFDGSALVNRLLCSASRPDSSQGRPTGTMFQNCGSHFAATMSILEPTIVIVQGRTVAKWVTPVLVPNGGVATSCTRRTMASNGCSSAPSRIPPPTARSGGGPPECPVPEGRRCSDTAQGHRPDLTPALPGPGTHSLPRVNQPPGTARAGRDWTH